MNLTSLVVLAATINLPTGSLSSCGTLRRHLIAANSIYTESFTRGLLDIYLPTYLSTYLSSYLPTYLPTYPHSLTHSLTHTHIHRLSTFKARYPSRMQPTGHASN